MRHGSPTLLLIALTLSACAPDDATNGVRPDGGGLPADSAPEPQVPPADTTAASAESTIATDRVGHLRIGQSEEEVRTRPVRDTTWMIEGMTERGAVAVVGPGEATVLLSNGAVDRIYVRDPALLTAEGLGVGSSLGELRAAFGRACVGAGERGGVVVWFAGLHGVSFALDQPLGSDFPAIERDPSRLPDDARVEELWVHRGRVEC